MSQLKEAPKDLEIDPAIVEQKLNQLLWQAGQHQFNGEIIKAELLQWNQEILRLKNKLTELKKEPVKAVTPDEILPADPTTPKIS